MQMHILKEVRECVLLGTLISWSCESLVEGGRRKQLGRSQERLKLCMEYGTETNTTQTGAVGQRQNDVSSE